MQGQGVRVTGHWSRVCTTGGAAEHVRCGQHVCLPSAAPYHVVQGASPGHRLLLSQIDREAKVAQLEDHALGE